MLTQDQIDKALLQAATFMEQEGIEGFREKPYKDSAGVPTIGIGATYYEDGAKVTMGDKPVTRERARQITANLLKKDFLPAVMRNVPNLKTVNQMAAILSFTYNMGEGALASSTLKKKILAEDWDGAAAEFLKWNKARNAKTKQLEVLAGLVTRRDLESKMFKKPD